MREHTNSTFIIAKCGTSLSLSLCHMLLYRSRLLQLCCPPRQNPMIVELSDLFVIEIEFVFPSFIFPRFAGLHSVRYYDYFGYGDVFSSWKESEVVLFLCHTLCPSSWVL